MEELQDGEILDCKLNFIFTALIPKVEGSQGMEDFRPISLLRSMYKVITKVLAGRMRKVLNVVISQYQNAFVKGKQIL